MTPARRHLGSELPAFSDQLDSNNPLPDDCLAFSHGRAALTWLVQQYRFRSVLLCAYTCPSVTECFRRLGLEIALFDVDDGASLVADTAEKLPMSLVLIPALFGGAPAFSPSFFAGWSLVDAAQTAFGHLIGRHVSLSCPRKTTSLADGAILHLPGWSRDQIEALPLASLAGALKSTARMLWRDEQNDLAVDFNTRAEEAWPLEPCRMSPESLWTLEHMDVEWHETRRKNNYNKLQQLLHGIPHHDVDGVPFGYPILVKNRDEVLDTLHYESIYATKLWWDAEFDRSQFPVSARYADELVCLPVDQRHTEDDMERIADVVRYVAEY